MKQIKTKSCDILCVEVPNNVMDYSNSLLRVFQDYYAKNNPDDTREFLIIGLLSELTDKDCEEFVEFNFPFDGQYIKIYKNYSYMPLEPWDTNPWYNLAKESFLSLLQSEGIDTTKEHLIIKVL